MEFKTVDDIREFVKTATVRDTLACYFGVDENNSFKDVLFNQNVDMIEYWAESNDLEPNELAWFINEHLDDKVDFNVISECGNGGGWPECEINLCDNVVLGFDWVIE